MKQLVQTLLGKFGYSIRRTSTLQGGKPGSATRPIGACDLFLEDIRAPRFHTRDNIHRRELIRAVELCEPINGKKLNHACIQDKRDDERIWRVGEARKCRFDLKFVLNQIHKVVIAG